MRPASIIAAAALLASCNALTPEPPGSDQAKRDVADMFAYPSSAEFKGLHAGIMPHQICGSARGRGEDGQMTDYRHFNWQPGDGQVFVEGMLQKGAPEGNPDWAKLSDSMLQVGCTWN